MLLPGFLSVRKKGGRMHKRNLPKIAFVLVAALLGTASTAWCDPFSLTLISSGGGVYGYGITLPANSSVTFLQGQTIALTGMSLVTGASVGSAILNAGFTVQSSTSSSVTFVQTLPAGSSFSTSGSSTPFTFVELFVDSTAPLGTVNWAGHTNLSDLSGTVGGPGPVAPTTIPEPGSLPMLLARIAALGLVVFARRRGMLRPNQLPT